MQQANGTAALPESVRRIPRRDIAAQSSPDPRWPESLRQLWRICRCAEATYLETLLPAADHYPPLDAATWQGYSDAAYALWRAVESTAQTELLLWEQADQCADDPQQSPDRLRQVAMQAGDQGVTQ